MQYPTMKLTGNVKTLIGIAVFLSALAYVQTLSYDFVYDDIPLVVENSLIKDIKNIPAFFQHEDVIDGSHTGYYRPLIPFSYLADYLIWGLNPLGYHLTNIIFHLTVIALLYVFALRVLGTPGGAFCACLFFGLHPLNTEAVAFITGRNNILCAVFILSSILAFGKYRDTDARRWLVLSLAFFFAGLLCKEFAVVIPLILVFSDLMNRRLQKADIYRYGSFLIPLGAYVAMRAAVLGGPLGITLTSADLSQRLYGAVDILVTYVRLSVLPWGQKALYEKQSVSIFRFILEVLFLALAAAVLYWQRARKWPVIGALWFVLFLLPVMNIVPIAGSPIAERYLYIPLMGMAIVFGGTVSSLQTGAADFRLGAAVVLVLAVFFLLTVTRNPVWKSDEDLYQDMVRTTPGAYKGYYDLGLVRYRQKAFGEAKSLWEKALTVKPDMMALHNNLGVLYEETGDYERAESHYRAVLGVRTMAKVYRNLGNVLLKQAKFDEAEDAYKHAILLEPKDLEGYLGLISYYESRGQLPRALDTALAAVQAMPGSADAHNVAGTVFGAMKRYPESVEYFERSVRLNPQCLECAYNLSMAKKFTRR
jgi:protein O-mannosyl-transferase